ncbi:MAG: hypothetical protein QM725_11805 [Lacibacter sp.]
MEKTECIFCVAASCAAVKHRLRRTLHGLFFNWAKGCRHFNGWQAQPVHVFAVCFYSMHPATAVHVVENTNDGEKDIEGIYVCNLSPSL